jgi:hypothetical protein
MPRTFKQWTPATAELELLHECWLARLPPAKIAARLCISEPKLKRFMRRGDAPAGACQATPAAPSSAIKRRRGPPTRAHLRRMSGADGGLSFRLGGGGEGGPVKIETKSN